MGKEPEAVEAFFGELELANGMDARFDDALVMLRKELSDMDALQFRARRLAEQMAMLLQGSLLLRHGDAAVADAFVGSRLAGHWGVAYGTLPAGVDTDAILARAAVNPA
jgi:putative acyl-CoA dehydrogenase